MVLIRGQFGSWEKKLCVSLVSLLLLVVPVEEKLACGFVSSLSELINLHSNGRFSFGCIVHHFTSLCTSLYITLNHIVHNFHVHHFASLYITVYIIFISVLWPCIALGDVCLSGNKTTFCVKTLKQHKLCETSNAWNTFLCGILDWSSDSLALSDKEHALEQGVCILNSELQYVGDQVRYGGANCPSKPAMKKKEKK